MLEKEIVVTKIAVALFMSGGQGRPIHRDRPTHGLALNVGCSSEYIFESGERLVCRSGECIYLPRGSNYTARRYEISEGKENGVYAINFLTLSDEIESPWVVKIKGEHEMRSLFSKAAKAWMKKEIGYDEECRADLYRIIKQIKKESFGYTSKKKTAELLAPAIEYIDANYATESISVPYLASLCGISEAYLRRAFQNAFLESPAVYMRNKRIAYAKELLLSGEYSVTETAMLSGFNDSAYFVREFKKAVGVSPSAYRREWD